MTVSKLWPTVKKGSLILLIILGTLIVIIIGAGMYKFNYLAGKDGYDVDGNKIVDTIQTQ